MVLFKTDLCSVIAFKCRHLRPNQVVKLVWIRGNSGIDGSLLEEWRMVNSASMVGRFYNNYKISRIPLFRKVNAARAYIRSVCSLQINQAISSTYLHEIKRRQGTNAVE